MSLSKSVHINITVGNQTKDYSLGAFYCVKKGHTTTKNKIKKFESHCQTSDMTNANYSKAVKSKCNLFRKKSFISL